MSSSQNKKSWISQALSTVGPGLVTGAADDDPSGIATYSQVGAQSGYGMLWTLLFSFPFMCAVQEISGRIGRVTGHGIAGNLRMHYSRWLLVPTVFLLFAANTINLGADLGMMGAALSLVIGGPVLPYVVLFAMVSLLMEIVIRYTVYVRYLKWLTLVLLAYVAVVFIIDTPWLEALKGTFFPRTVMNAKGFTALLAILGTTISPYLFFWQASEEAEEVRDTRHEHALRKRPEEAPRQLHRIRLDTYIGMAVSNGVAFFIVLTSAVTLHAHGIRTIQTAAQAAEALQPLAGRFAFLLFALGIVGTGLLAIPVLAGSTAYAVGEAFRMPVSLESRPKRAKAFYVVLSVSLLSGMFLNLIHINVIKALYWSSVLNGLLAAPVIALMMVMTRNPKVMGDFLITRKLWFMGWATALLMFAATVGLLLTL